MEITTDTAINTLISVLEEMQRKWKKKSDSDFSIEVYYFPFTVTPEEAINHKITLSITGQQFTSPNHL